MIKYIVGNAVKPIGDGEKFIIHVSNDVHAWGSGFVLAISKKWKMPEYYFRATKSLNLGDIQAVIVEKDITVINMIGQHGVGIDLVTHIPPIRYDAIRECLKKVNVLALEFNATIHAPRFGSGLAGGDWNVIEQIINDEITVDVTIYDLK
jgi:O-acetyl-ADP-ribose deacetylase (regulator of RNase III)